MKWYKKLKTFYKKHKIVGLCSILLLILLISVPISYAKYKSNMDVSIKTVAGEMIYDIRAEQNDSYVDNNVKYFYVYIDNFKVADGVKYLNSTECEYTLTISNVDSSTGLYRYISEKDGSSSGEEFQENLVYHGTLSTTEETQRLKVYVKSSVNLKSDVKYSISIDVVQKNMDN